MSLGFFCDAQFHESLIPFRYKFKWSLMLKQIEFPIQALYIGNITFHNASGLCVDQYSI